MFPRVLKFGLVAALLLGLAGVGAWIYRVDLVGWAVTRLLERQGLGPTSFTIDTVELQGFHAHDLTLRNGAIKAGDLTITYSPLELLSSHLGQVEIGGFALTLAVTKDGLEMAGQPFSMAGGGSPTTGGLRIDALSLRDAHLLLNTADGPIEATVSTVLAPSADNIQSSAFSATVTGPLVGARRKATIVIQKLGVELPAAGGLQLTLQDGSIAVDGLSWTAKGAEGKIAWLDGKTAAQLTIGQLANSQKPMLVTPLGLGITATLAGNLTDFSLQAKTIGKSPQTMQAKGQYDQASRSGTVNINVVPIVFHRGGLQPGDLFPAFGNPVDGLEGSLALAGVLRWKGTKLSPDLVLTLKQLAFATSTAQVQALNGAIKITGLSPLATAAGQTLTATIVTAGLPPTNLTLKGQLDPKPILKLDQLAFNFAGGQVTAAPFAIDPAAPAFGTTLQVDGVDLAEITKLLSLDGLSGTGQLDGPIPFVLKNGKVEITGGHLAARKPGVLSYRPSKLPDALASAGESVALALQALSDFHYDKLVLALDKGATGEGAVLLQLDGQNPAVMSGQPFHFNIRVDSNFDRLADIALASLRSAQELLRRATRRTTP
jgi:hypothetical protein